MDRRRGLAGAYACLVLWIAPPSAMAETTVRVGVLTKGNLEQAVRAWPPTIQFLTEQIPGTIFQFVPLGLHDVTNAVADEKIDFVLTNPASYVELEARYGASRIATLKNLWTDRIYTTQFGAVIFSRRDNEAIHTLEDLRGKRFLGVDELAFGGWSMAWRELRGMDIDPYREFAELMFAGNHESVVRAVRAGLVDAGTVRTGVLEEMARTGEIDLSELRILRPPSWGAANDESTERSMFPFLRSTRLYPEWPFAKMRHTDEGLAERVAVALLGMDPESLAALAANSAGWTVPLDYRPVHELMLELRLGPYQDLDEATLHELFERYRSWIVAIIAGLLILVATCAYVWGLNRRVVAAKRDLEREALVRTRAEDALSREKERAQVTLESIGDGIIRTDMAGGIDYINPAALRLIGLVGRRVLGRVLFDVLNVVDADTGEPLRGALLRSMRHGVPVSRLNSTLLIPATGGEHIHIDLRVAPIHSQQRAIIGAVVVFHDVTEIRRLSEQMAYQATHDALTHLVNRGEFERRLGAALVDAAASDRSHVLCYLDLDQFKIVNDTCGHCAGDQLLRQLADRLQWAVAKDDVLARLGGDEFGILLRNCNIERATDIVSALQRAIKDYRYTWGDKIFQVGASAGLVEINASSGTLADVMSAADSACYVAKEQGGNRVHVFEPNDADVVQRQGQMQWIQRLKRALEHDQFRLYCEEFMPLRSELVERPHFEILLRLMDEHGGEVSPMTFIPAAERYFLMPAVDRWVVGNVFQRIAWADEAPRQLRHTPVFAINLSGQSLSDESFLGFLVDRFHATGIDPERICFEITETAAITNLAKAVRFMSVLKGMGCRFALDDFGSGLSSFAYLKNLPVDFLKIDGAFVMGCAEDSVDRAMVEAINQIGQLMGLRTIAECVERTATLELLRALGVDFAQSRHLNPAITLDAALASRAAVGAVPVANRRRAEA